MPRPRPSDRATLAQADDCRKQDRDQVTQRGVHDRQQDGRSVLLISLAWPPAFAGACPRRPRGRCAGETEQSMRAQVVGAGASSVPVRQARLR
jgi:hypothetical protein